jgi:hypothetical protein
MTPTPTGTPTWTPTPTATLPPHSTPVSFAFQNGLWPEPSYLGVADTYIDEYYPSKPYGQAYELKVYYSGRQKMLLHFDLAGYIPANAIVSAARLELYAYNRGVSGVGTAVGAYEILRPWAEAAATWNDAAPDEAWQVPGCNASGDRSSDPAAVTTFRYTNQWQVWEGDQLTQLVQRWVSSPSTNSGVLLAPLAGSPRQWWTLHSAQSVRDPGQRPRLHVTFQVPPPTPAPTHTATSSATPAATATSTPSRVVTATPTSAAPHKVFLPVILSAEDGTVPSSTGLIGGSAHGRGPGAFPPGSAVSWLRGVAQSVTGLRLAGSR